MGAGSFSAERADQSWYTATEWTVLSILAALSLTLAVLSTTEIQHIRSTSRAGEGGLSHGQQIRRWFICSIAVANGSRGVCLVVESLYVHLYGALQVKPNPLTQFSFLVLPSLVFFTMYSLLTVYLAQLCYAVRGQPFFIVRNAWFVVNVSLYFAVLCGLYITCSLDWVASCLAVVTMGNLGALSWYTINVFRYFPIPSGVGQSADNLKKITDKLLPMLIVCFVGICCEMVLYVLLQQGVVNYDQDANTLILVTFAETLPSMVFLNFLSKAQEGGSGEQKSLLSASPGANTGSGSEVRAPIISAGAGRSALLTYGSASGPAASKV